MLIELEYSSLFSYCPSSFTEKGQKAKKIMSAVKNERVVYIKLGKELKEIQGSQLVAKVLNLKKDLFEDFFLRKCNSCSCSQICTNKERVSLATF